MTMRLIIRNDNGKVAFTSEALNPCVAASGNATATSRANSPVNGQALREFNISYTPRGATPPIIAIRPVGGRAMYFTRGSSGGVMTWTFLTNLAAGATMQFWIFDQPVYDNTGSGLLIREDGTSRIMYCTGNKPLRIRPPFITGDMLTHDGMSTAQPGAAFQDYTQPAGKVYAAIIADPAIYWTYVYVGAGRYTYSTISESVQIIDNVIRTSGLWYSRESSTTTSPNHSADYFRLNRTIIPVDVTNY